MYRIDQLRKAEHLRERADKVLWLWLAIACLGSAITFVLDPSATSEQSAVGRVIYPYTYVWQALLAVAGASLLYGLLRRRLEWEVLGLFLMVGAILINFLALLSIIPRPLLSTYVVYPALIVAGVVRIHARLRLSVAVKERDSK